MMWEQVELKDLCSDISYGYTASASSHDTGVKFVRITDIVQNVIDWNSVPFCKVSADDLKKYKLEAEDIVIARTGATVGFAKYIRKNSFTSVFASYLIRLRIKPEYNSCFIGILVQSYLYKKYVNSIVGGAAQPNASAPLLTGFRFSLPPLPTQKKIASILSAFDDLIENNLKRIKLLEEAAELLYRELIATGTKKETLCNIYNTNSGSTPPRTNAKYFSGKINWFKTRELNDSVLFKSEERITQEAVSRVNLKIQSPGAVLIAMYGATIGRLGILSEASTTNQACCTITSKNDVYPLIYIFQWLKANKEFILNLRMGAAQQNISQEIVRNLEVDIPNDLVSLKEYALRIENCYAAIKNYMAQNIILANSRDLLLPKLMSGEIKV